MSAAPLHSELADGPADGFATWLTTADSHRIRLGVWPAGSRGTVFIMPGRSEAIEKYGRAAEDLRRRGYAAIAVDWRGQGLSQRTSHIPYLGHVRRFLDYQTDIKAVIAALPGLGLPAPLFVLAHSMGGAIALRSLHQGLPVKAAVFSAPMWGLRIAPSLRPVAWALASGARAARLGLTLAPGTDLSCYVAVTPFQGNVLTTDPEMFAWMKRQVHAVPELGLGGPSLHWVHEALIECRRLRAIASPAIPALTLLGSGEKIVDPLPIHDRMRRWPGGTLEIIDSAEHEVLMETPAIRAHAFDRMAAFFAASS